MALLSAGGQAVAMAPGDLLPVPEAGLGGGATAIYRAARDGYDLFYAPGCLCVVPSSEANAFAADLALPGAKANGWAGELLRRATHAASTAAARRDGAAFRPECLTLYLHNECNLGCTYCYAAPRGERGGRLEANTVAAAAELVAASCQSTGRPMTVVFHGGGEPTLYPEELDELLDCVGAVAAGHSLALFRYVATNGSVPEARIAWLARRFDLVGLSCDGPAAIHDAQRPGRDGRGTLPAVERTARALRAAGRRFHVRATITGHGLGHQSEIADHICRHLAPKEIHFEPAYGGRHSGPGAALKAGDAPEFVAGLMAARAVAAGYGVFLTSSVCRPGTVHGPYCHVFRQVLNLLPPWGAGVTEPAVATACFKDSTAEEALERGTACGQWEGGKGRFVMDEGRVAALRAQLAALPTACVACFNRFHCTRGCPDVCSLAGEGPGQAAFRCSASRFLAAALFAERAEALWAEVRAGKAPAPHGCLLT
jgi:sulfatase maturation enzyme AslB (radical SAM superfamily)